MNSAILFGFLLSLVGGLFLVKGHMDRKRDREAKGFPDVADIYSFGMVVGGIALLLLGILLPFAFE